MMPSYGQSRMLMRKNLNNDVSKDSPIYNMDNWSVTDLLKLARKLDR